MADTFAEATAANPHIPERPLEGRPDRVWVRNLSTGLEWEVSGDRAARLLAPSVLGAPEYEEIPNPTAAVPEDGEPSEPTEDEPTGDVPTGPEPTFGTGSLPLSSFAGMAPEEMTAVQGVGPVTAAKIAELLAGRETA